MAELHVFGQITGASEFATRNLLCKWCLIVGDGWTVLEGLREGQTHVNFHHYEEISTWCHPVDIHLSTQGIQCWPKLYFQVWHQDHYGRNDLCGYGICFVPSTPGFHSLDCHIWRPLGSLSDEIARHFLGGSLHLQEPESTCGGGLDRFRLRTTGMGKIHLELYVIQRNFQKYGIET
ncbi:B9 domain-containing protein 2-like [Ornithodoros turicata]|uniref:B9 domain-containing protein 2-like n=1 Tax=Ornithodoros turicata TaxID=34597 RepID=UPI00313921BB